jgi:hypothetical protein
MQYAVVNGEYVLIQFSELDEKVRCHVRCSEVKKIMLCGIMCIFVKSFYIILPHPSAAWIIHFYIGYVHGVGGGGMNKGKV